MAKIIIAGDAMVIESSAKLEDIKALEKHNPKALSLYENDGKTEVFRVGSTNGQGAINAFGASFGSASKNGSGKAIITMKIPADVSDAKAYAEETVGTAIISLNTVEAQFATALEKVAQDKTAVRECISVM